MKTNLSITGVLLASLTGLGLAASTASSQVMFSPVAVTVDTNLNTFPGSNEPENMIDQSGLHVPFVSGSTAFDPYFSDPIAVLAANEDGTKWVSELAEDLQLAGNVDFDLGSSLSISKLAIWNVAVENLSVIVSENQAGLDTAPAVGSYTLPSHTTSVSYPPVVLDFGSARQGRYVRLAIQTEYPVLPGYEEFGGYASVGEVVVSVAGTPAPPLDISIESNGDIRLMFTGTLQSSTNANGTFINVTGNPQGTHLIPRAAQQPRQFFRARSDLTTGNDR